ncbi:MAG: outer membrane protein transport protein [Candidatus Aminicenantes bacterium]|nr:outer membrane protein transport protein [Candidatus Aminicenantes bacterium]
MKKLFIIIVCFTIISSGLLGGGWNNSLIGCRALAIGGAFAGLADDTSAIFYNPAGLSFQQKIFSVSINGFNIWPTHEYSNSMGSNLQSKSTFSLPQIFFTFKASERLTLGFGAYTPYAGGGVEWNDSGLGLQLKSSMGIFSLTPTLAYKINENISIGFNLNIYRGIIEDTRTLQNIGTVKTEENGSAFSVGFGLMLRPNERLGIGLGVRGPARMKLSGKTTVPIEIPELGTFDANLISETQFNLPWDFNLGVSYKLTENFLFSSSVQYTMWSALDNIEKTLKNIPVEGDQITIEPMNFKNILIWSVGAEYWVSPFLALRGGIGIDHWATPAERLDFSNIDVDKITFLGGIGYRSGRIQIDFVYVNALGKEREKMDVVLGFPVKEKFNLNTTILGIGITYAY